MLAGFTRTSALAISDVSHAEDIESIADRVLLAPASDMRAAWPCVGMLTRLVSTLAVVSFNAFRVHDARCQLGYPDHASDRSIAYCNRAHPQVHLKRNVVELLTPKNTPHFAKGFA